MSDTLSPGWYTFLSSKNPSRFTKENSALFRMWSSLLIAIFGLFFWFAPAQRQIVGVLIVVLSVASLVTSDLGGFVLGMLFGIVGGAMGFAWTPVRPPAQQVEAEAPLAVPATSPE